MGEQEASAFDNEYSIFLTNRNYKTYIKRSRQFYLQEQWFVDIFSKPIFTIKWNSVQKYQYEEFFNVDYYSFKNSTVIRLRITSR